MTPENISWLMIGAQLMMLIWMTAKALNFSRMGKELEQEIEKLRKDRMTSSSTRRRAAPCFTGSNQAARLRCRSLRNDSTYNV